ncbi:MAG: PASTA domain-containing protein [Candidatus Cyclobacteriaceae bacterium M2_1C_046]
MKKKQNSLKQFLINLAIVLAVSATILLVFFYVFLPNQTSHGETVTVPKLTGLQLDDIPSYVGDHLRYEVSDSSYSEEYPPLTVLEQYPRPGHKVKEKRKIFLTVNRVQPPTVPLPDLLDHSLVNAEAVLRSNELKRGRMFFEPSPYLNLVLKMKHEGEEIKPGTRLPKGSVIDLVVGNGYGGNNKFPAPDLTSYTLDEAKIAIRGSSLNLGVIIVKGDTTGQLPVVIKQKPDPYEEVRMGETIDLWIEAQPDTLNRVRDLMN